MIVKVFVRKKIIFSYMPWRGRPSVPIEDLSMVQVEDKPGWK